MRFKKIRGLAGLTVSKNFLFIIRREGRVGSESRGKVEKERKVLVVVLKCQPE